MLVLDQSASMSLSQKWTDLSQAVVTVLDRDSFDGLTLGASLYPSGSVNAPACLMGLIPTVECASPATPQLPLQAAGTSKSTAPSGVRHALSSYLTSNAPITSDTADSAPVYDTLHAAYGALDSAGLSSRLALLWITDSGGSCTSVSSPTRPGYSDGTCNDWEEPPTLDALISSALSNAATPVQTFVVGLPDTNSTGGANGAYSTPPYHMLLALSTYAVSGSPTTVPASCDKTAVFSQTGADPSVPCHADLSNASTFSVSALSTAISTLRERALGCLYALPPPPMGQTIDHSKVNVTITADGVTTAVPRRASASNACTSTPCWDYDASGNVSLLGAACDTASAATALQVQVQVGCPTATK
jgi:hypothetical protein